MRLSRSEAIQDIREMLLCLVDDDHSLCEVVSRAGIFCGGFSQWDFDELKHRFRWIAAEKPNIDRAEFERLANRWLLTHQWASYGRLPCDRFAQARASCAGWNDFYEADLARYYEQLFGERIQVVPDGLKSGDGPGE
jgi:hypothetical protein